MTLRTLVIGLGSHHGDDAIGWQIARRLGGLVDASIEVRIATTPAHLLDWLNDVDSLHLIDACYGAGNSGHLYCWTWPTLPAEVGLAHTSSHGLPWPEILALAERLGRLPRDVIIWGVEIPNSHSRLAGACFDDDQVARFARVILDQLPCSSGKQF